MQKQPTINDVTGVAPLNRGMCQNVCVRAHKILTPHVAKNARILKIRSLASLGSAVSDTGVHLPCTQGFAVHSLFLTSDMPDAPTMSAADNMTAARQKVGHPRLLGANPNSHFLESMPVNGMFSLYLNGRFFRQRTVKEEFWTEDPTALITMLLRHSNDGQLHSLRRNRVQGDIALIDFLQTDVMKRNLPRLCPASLWALAHCMGKQRFTFATVTGTGNLKGDANFLLDFNRYLTEEKQVDPAAYEPLIHDHKGDSRRRVRRH